MYVAVAVRVDDIMSCQFILVRNSSNSMRVSNPSISVSRHDAVVAIVSSGYDLGMESKVCSSS